MQEASHHGQVIREYRELRMGITQEELARRVGRSRRTIVAIEQSARIGDPKLRRALAWALEIPPELFGLSVTAVPGVAILNPLGILPDDQALEEKGLNSVVFETFAENLRMRFDLYYMGSSLAADRGLNDHIGKLEKLLRKTGSKGRKKLLTLLSHNYQLKGMVSRDQLDYESAENCFVYSSSLAVEAECVELNALALARRANMYVWQRRFIEADQFYGVAREIARRSAPGLRTFLVTGHAEVQGLLKNRDCLESLTEARNLLARIDPADDPLLLLHSTRCSEQAIGDGWSQCHALLGMPDVAIESYDKLERVLDLRMTRMRARLYTQYAEALYIGRDMSCCFYAIEGLKLARSADSQYNINRVKELASKLNSQFPNDARVKELLQAIRG